VRDDLGLDGERSGQTEAHEGGGGAAHELETSIKNVGWMLVGAVLNKEKIVEGR
jgi:hypothetical protein